MKFYNSVGDDVRSLTSSDLPKRIEDSLPRLLPSRRGVALIITIIMLAVVTFMALTFLAMSRRERGAVTITTDTATARLAADDALASAEAQIMANTLAATNPYNFGLLVSTNYINPLGFVPGVVSPTNVSYYYAANGQPVNASDFPQLLANLYYLPRAPVLISTNDPVQGRFYLDLNRNGYFETNGPVVDANGTETNFEVGDPEWIGVLQHPDQPCGPNNPFVARYAFVAVPIGNALDLNAIYNEAVTKQVNPSPTNNVNDGFMRNQGVGSWEINLAAFLADLNNNEWGQIVGSGANPPVGSAAWYQYNEANPSPFANSGAAFSDALSLLSYRYGYNYNNLASANNMFVSILGIPQAANVFPYDGIDAYSVGPVMTGFQLPVDNDVTTYPWSSADNTNQFFDLQELFNPNETSVVFTNRLLSVGELFNPANSDPTNFYNRYTYYRLLSQMGVESAPEQNKINLNYSNAVAYFDRNGVLTNIAILPGAETNFTPWTPLQFFTIAADKMLRDYSQEWLVESPSNYLATYGSFTNISTAANPALNPTNMPIPFGVSDIPVYVNGQFVYTPAVQRVLQLAANIYDATTNNTATLGANFPSVFRPIFNVVPVLSSAGELIYTNVYIAGYEPVQTLVNGIQQIGAVTGPSDPQLALPVNVTDLLTLSPNIPNPPYPPPFGIYTNVNVYGVPWIVGAKKGWPNFNEFALESVFQLTRKLQVTRPSTNATVDLYQYNQMFNLSLSNQFGVECWNSYTNDYLRSVDIYVTCTNSCLFTNDENFSTSLGSLISGYLHIDMNSNANNGWPGYTPTVYPLLAPLSFQIPLDTNVTIITNSMYRFDSGAPFLTTNLALDYEQNVVNPVTGASYPQPHWILITSNDVRVIVLDTQTGPPYHIIDYVQLSGPNSLRDLTSEIISQYDTQPGPNGNDLWNTNLQNNLPIGLISLIGVSLGNYNPGAASGNWDTTDETLRENEIDGFRAFFGLSPIYNNVGAQQAIAKANSTNYTQAPYLPTAMVVQHFSWQANDPLVHYTASDLNWSGANQLNRTADDLTNENLGHLNQRYMPWGGNPLLSGADKNPFSLSLKDPLVWQSDDWDFPTYKFPTVGWLGRVHRGTPWQTVYLKAPDVLQGIQVTGGVTNYVGTNVWEQWTGNALLTSGQYYDAVNTAPVQDRLLFDTFTTALNDNATRGQLSVNVGASDPNNPLAGLAAWSALLSGVQVLSNNAPDAVVNTATGAPGQHNGSLGNFIAFPINPAGPGGAVSALGQIVQGINQTRTNFYNVDGLQGAFEHVGDILAVPQLTYQSPFLHLSNYVNNIWIEDSPQKDNGISDEMYEWLPQQVMSLLRVSGTPQSPMRYVIYSYGQALKPAPNGIYTGGGAYFGMITNYQVVAESATRAVVNFGSVETNVVSMTNDAFDNPILFSLPVVTNNNAVIVQFNPLPPN